MLLFRHFYSFHNHTLRCGSFVRSFIRSMVGSFVHFGRPVYLFAYCLYCYLLFLIWLLIIVQLLTKLKHKRSPLPKLWICAHDIHKAEIISLKSMTWFKLCMCVCMCSVCSGVFVLLRSLFVWGFCFVRWIRCQRWLLFQLDTIFTQHTTLHHTTTKQHHAKHNLVVWPKWNANNTRKAFRFWNTVIDQASIIQCSCVCVSV